MTIRVIADRIGLDRQRGWAPLVVEVGVRIERAHSTHRSKEVSMSTDPKTVTEIEYTLNPENLWVGDPEREGIDAEASARRYAEMLRSCFEELYPHAAVKIMIDDTSLGCHVETDGSKAEIGASDAWIVMA